MRILSTAATALFLVGVASAAHASGSGSGSGSSFGSSRGFDGLNGSASAREAREYERLFRRGRAQVRKHITCKKCDLHKQLDKNNALQVADGVVKGKYAIKQEDRTAVLVYLRERYKL